MCHSRVQRDLLNSETVPCYMQGRTSLTQHIGCTSTTTNPSLATTLRPHRLHTTAYPVVSLFGPVQSCFVIVRIDHSFLSNASPAWTLYTTWNDCQYPASFVRTYSSSRGSQPRPCFLSISAPCDALRNTYPLVEENKQTNSRYGRLAELT